jgi:predicted nucleic acid-binding protein
MAAGDARPRRLTMTTAIDTNIIVALWDQDSSLKLAARAALEAAFRRGNLIVAAPVFAELLAAPGRTESFVNAFFEDTGIAVDWELGEDVWRSGGKAFGGYSERRRNHRQFGSRRILADFLIGAHAFVHAYRLLTMDERLYRAAFPKLQIDSI